VDHLEKGGSIYRGAGCERYTLLGYSHSRRCEFISKIFLHYTLATKVHPLGSYSIADCAGHCSYTVESLTNNMQYII
jgi:hypothetical protein